MSSPSLAELRQPRREAPYVSRLRYVNRALRLVWSFAYILFFRPSPKPLYAWRRLLLRLFGAKVGSGVHVHSSTKVWAPWNLEMEDHSCLAPNVDCYCVAPVSLGKFATVSQYSYLCTATHDYESRDFALVSKPIRIGAQAWVAAKCFVGPGVTLGEGAVVGATSSVYKDVPPWTVVAGNPARLMKQRRIRG